MPSEPDDDFAKNWFRLVGILQRNHRRGSTNVDVWIGFDQDGLRVGFNDLVTSTFTLAATSADPVVIRFFLRCYVAWQNVVAMSQMGEVRRRRERREEQEKRSPRVRACPECNATGELYIMDKLVPCPRCDGLGWVP